MFGNCPNKNSVEWKNLVEHFTEKNTKGKVIESGENLAWTLLHLNRLEKGEDAEIPTVEEAQELVDNYYRSMTPYERVKIVFTDPKEPDKLNNRSNMILNEFYNIIDDYKEENQLDTTMQVLEHVKQNSPDKSISSIFNDIIESLIDQAVVYAQKDLVEKEAEIRLVLDNFDGLLSYMMTTFKSIEGISFEVSSKRLNDLIRQAEARRLGTELTEIEPEEPTEDKLHKIEAATNMSGATDQTGELGEEFNQYEEMAKDG